MTLQKKRQNPVTLSSINAGRLEIRKRELLMWDYYFLLILYTRNLNNFNLNKKVKNLHELWTFLIIVSTSMLNINVIAGAVGAGTEAVSRCGSDSFSGSTKMIRLLAAPAPQHCTIRAKKLYETLPVEIRWIFANPIQVGSDTITDFFSDIYFPHKYLAC
jgi:hypothetical protein